LNLTFIFKKKIFAIIIHVAIIILYDVFNKVWKYLAITIIIAVASLFAVSRLVPRLVLSKTRQENEPRNELRQLENAATFIFGIIVMQGLKIRFK
jgi:hypothetical protein